MGVTLNELRDDTAYHFRRDESIMDASEYPHRINHKWIHEILAKRAT